MDKNEAIKIVTRYSDKVNKKFPVERVFIFGSFARGTNHPDSDIDVALIFKSITNIFDLQVELMWLRSNDDLIIEPHPFSAADLSSPGPLLKEVLEHGIEITNFAA
jgi:predicted nucleotidyltransferase